MKESERVQDEYEMASKRTEVKSKLRDALTLSHGSTKSQDVVDLIEELVTLNPSRGRVSESELLMGEFHILSGPNFPGRMKPKEGQESVFQFTLGRISFNIFQPNNLVCTIHKVRNIVSPLKSVDDQLQTKYSGKKLITYDLIIDLTIHTPEGDLSAVIRNDAVCFQNDQKLDRMMVSFHGGTLLPSDETKSNGKKMNLWAKTFKGAYQEAREQKSIVTRIFQYVMNYIFGLTLPTDDDRKYEFHFQMNRCPLGYLDIMYLDKDMRISKGNRGTIVIVSKTL